MQVQHVHLVEREHVDVLLDLFDGEEVARNIEHRTSPGETRRVDNCLRWYLPGTPLASHLRFDIGGQQLSDGLNSVKQSGRAIGDEPHGIRGDGETVSFVADRCGSSTQS